MTVDYERLRAENVVRYGTDIGRIGGMLLANRYDKRTHFIYELLQNAEDALRRRENWSGSRSVAFELTPDELTIIHSGAPFNEADVRGVCGIDESTKDITSIGRFGIGFKSVYAFTDRPEVHSGNEAFAIENYVWPVAATGRRRDPDQTIIVLPLQKDDEEAQAEIVEGLQNLGPRTLLFLRNVKEISWSVRGGASGLYFRDNPVERGDGVRELSLMGQQHGQKEVEEKWLVFSKEIHNAKRLVGHVEVAFYVLVEAKTPKIEKVEPLPDSTLVVFFPTVVATNTGFLIQGPYRTTPSRDNIPAKDIWNRILVRETGDLLIEAMKWLAARKMLDAGTLKCLPIEREKFSDGLFSPLFQRVIRALKTEALLPCSDSSYASAADVRLSRTQDLRELLQPDQLGAILKAERPLKWLSAEITADRTPVVRQYLMRELGLSEQTPESLLPNLDASFLQNQSDDWIVRLYEFLNKVPSVVEQLDGVPLVRLEDGTHVSAFVMEQPQAFLPTDAETDFPTARRSVCASQAATKFLLSLKLTQPDPVDDVIRNLLPKYQSRRIRSDNYAADIDRILRAFDTDSNAQKDKLIKSLKLARFVKTKSMEDETSSLQWPDHVYLATARLKELFKGVPGVNVVDDSQDCLRGEDVRELLEASGAARYIYPVPLKSTLSDEEKRELRRSVGVVNATWEGPVEDFGLRGLPALLEQFPTLNREGRIAKARLLWEALIELRERRGQSVFSGTYRWQYFQWRSASFSASFVRQLNEVAWVPNADGDLQPPSAALFELLGWPADPFLLSRIHFKKPIVEELAREAGIEASVLDMLKKYGLTSMKELMARLNIDDLVGKASSTSARNNKQNGSPEAKETLDNEVDSQTVSTETGGGDSAESVNALSEHEDSTDEDDEGRSQGGAQSGLSKNDSRKSRADGERTFISYVATHPDDGEEGRDTDGLDHAERLLLEQRAIELICSREPLLKTMPAGNEGFDLIETDANDEPERWVEVKAMKGSLENRPVGLSSAQFEFARQHGEQYWLYVVEHADDPDSARIVKINNPAGRAGTFTFDKGWAAVAVMD